MKAQVTEKTTNVDNDSHAELLHSFMKPPTAISLKIHVWIPVEMQTSSKQGVSIVCIWKSSCLGTAEMVQRWFSRWRACSTNVRTRVWIPGTYMKWDAVVHICNPSAPKRIWEMETARPRQLQIGSKDIVTHKVEGDDWHLRLSFTQIASL